MRSARFVNYTYGKNEIGLKNSYMIYDELYIVLRQICDCVDIVFFCMYDAPKKGLFYLFANKNNR